MAPRRSLPSAGDRTARLLAIIDRFPTVRLVVVGDCVADEFIAGRVARISREAPVLILELDTTALVPGGAGNAANNAATLGARTAIFGCVGRDETGRRLLESFHQRVDRRGLVRLADYNTPSKTRVLAGGVHSVKQQIVRIDRRGGAVAAADVRSRFDAALAAALDRADGVLCSDYGSGLVTPAFVRSIRQVARRKVPVLIDSRYDLARYRGLTACTPNEAEVEHMLDVRLNDEPRQLERAGRAVLERTRMAAVLVTRGSRGMALFENGRRTVHIPVFGGDEVADVTGAGDTVIATMTVALAAGAGFEDAARLANYAGGIVVMKRNTATVTADELARAVTSSAGL
jgi:D-glycero-beta-D-manno-heptose-7-phosphate kinase